MKIVILAVSHDINNNSLIIGKLKEQQDYNLNFFMINARLIYCSKGWISSNFRKEVNTKKITNLVNFFLVYEIHSVLN